MNFQGYDVRIRYYVVLDHEIQCVTLLLSMWKQEQFWFVWCLIILSTLVIIMNNFTTVYAEATDILVQHDNLIILITLPSDVKTLLGEFLKY